MDISVIIVNYNVRPFLENALVSVKKALIGFRGETIVIDNASDDGSVEMVQDKFPEVRLIKNEHNLGFGAANNMAAQASTGKYVLFLNPDTILQENTIRVMVDFFEQSSDVGLAGCRILNPDGTLQLACRRSFPTPWVAFTKIFGLSAIFPHSPLFAKYNLTYLDSNETREVDAVSGSFMFVRRSVFEQVGRFDEQFFMYGEDLDFCYRVKTNGWKVFYVPLTQIIHYKGESVRRSDIDDVRLFYQAMRIFVHKHFTNSLATDVILRAGIAMREWVAFVGRIAKPLRSAAFDYLLVTVSVFLACFLRFGEFFRYPAYAYPIILTVPGIIIVATMYSLGAYTVLKLSLSRALQAVVVGYIILSALTFFFNQYAFSRLLVLISGGLNLFLLPGWRLAAKMWSRSPERPHRALFGRPTLIVGTDPSGQEVLRKLRARVDDGYDVVGFIDITRRRVGEKVAGVEILGSMDNIRKVIQEHKVSEVIFSTNTLAYTDILSVIERTRSRSVNFRLVPNSLDVIIGKTHIDELNDIPLVDIEYNIHKYFNKINKRLFDIVGSLLLLVLFYPVVVFKQQSKTSRSQFWGKIVLLPGVLRGKISLVGFPERVLSVSRNGVATSNRYPGKVGLTGLVQLQDRNELSSEEIEKYCLYYAKNQSLLLDVEILIKSIVHLKKQ